METNSRRTVVIVDDDPDIRDVLRMLFDKENFDVVGEALNGHQAMALAREHRPDYIVLDYLMPTINGASAANALRLLSPDTRVIAFSSALTRKPEWADAFLNKERIAEIPRMLQTLSAGTVS